MGWEDRPYNRDQNGSFTNPVALALNGSMPMFTAFRVRVRAHTTLFIFVVGAILFGFIEKDPYPLGLRVLSMGLWVAIVIMHEFGHCFVARWVEGSADEVILWPMGGLASTDPPHRPLAIFLTTAGGPAVNILLGGAAAIGIYTFTTPHLWIFRESFQTLLPQSQGASVANLSHAIPAVYTNPALYCWWIYHINFLMLAFNLLPIYPLDGAPLLQSMVWPLAGNFRSLMMVTTLGMVFSVMGVIVGFASQSWFIAMMFMWTFFECYQRRAAVRENVQEDWHEPIDFHASIYAPADQPKRRRLSPNAIRKARRISQKEIADRQRIDDILGKVSARGITSLTFLERRLLRKTTERQRRRETELSKFT